MNAQVILGTYQVIAMPGLELRKCGLLLLLDRDPCVLGNTEAQAIHCLILMGLTFAPVHLSVSVIMRIEQRSH